MIQSLASLEKIVVQLRQKKQEATKLRKKAEEQIKEFRSAEKHSSSGLHLLDKKIESEKEESADVSTVIDRKNSQLESIGRLVTTAEERLAREKETIEQIEQEIEFADNFIEKQNAETRLRSLNDHVRELIEEIKSRQKTAKKISDDVAAFSGIKSKIVSKIQKQTKSKPSLRETKTANHKSVQKFLKELQKRIKTEESAQKSLDKANVKLKELLANRRKITAKKKTTSKKSPAKKKTTSKKSPAKKKTTSKKSPAKKKTTSKKSPAKKKTTSKKSPAKKKTTSKKSPAKKKTTSKKSKRR